jgi:hypothetical protein
MNAIVAPTVENVWPNVAVEGDPELMVELRGQRFVPSSTVTFNGTQLQSRFENPSVLKATIPAAMLKAVGTYPIHVIDRSGEQTYRSNQVFFIVKFR